MLILLWLLPAALATAAAMAAVAWTTRAGRIDPGEQQELLAEAILRPLPGAAQQRRGGAAPSGPRESSTGVAGRQTRRSA